MAEMPAGVIVPLHSHQDRETFFILSGEIKLYDGTSWRILKQSDFVDVLGNTKHAWRNTSKSSASLLVVTTVKKWVYFYSEYLAQLRPGATPKWLRLRNSISSN
jgi:quercetin dioxygenase-like cupin family protein